VKIPPKHYRRTAPREDYRRQSPSLRAPRCPPATVTSRCVQSHYVQHATSRENLRVTTFFTRLLHELHWSCYFYVRTKLY